MGQSDPSPQHLEFEWAELEARSGEITGLECPGQQACEFEVLRLQGCPALTKLQLFNSSLNSGRFPEPSKSPVLLKETSYFPLLTTKTTFRNAATEQVSRNKNSGFLHLCLAPTSCSYRMKKSEYAYIQSPRAAVFRERP